MARAAHYLLVTTCLLAACAPPNRHLGAPKPDRSLESLADEAKIRRLDLLDAVRLPDIDRLRSTFAPNAILIRPNGDTVRGIDAIARELIALRAALPFQSVRAVAMRPTVRCYDGLLDRYSEWSLTILGADSIPHFVRGPVAIHWTSRGDSLAAGEVDLRPTASINDGRMGCISTDAVRYAARRIELFYVPGFATPTSFYHSADKTLLAAGYHAADSPDPTHFPDGGPAATAQMVGLSARVIDHAWLTFAEPTQMERSELGRCDPRTFNFVGLGRDRRLWSLSLDARFHGFSVGAGPVFATDHYRYQEVDFIPRPLDQVYLGQCEAEVVMAPLDSSTSMRRSTGVGSSVSYMLAAGPHTALVLRWQRFQFPPAPGLRTSRGLSLSFHDVTTTLGLGLAFTY